MKNKMLKPKTGSFLLDETGIGVVEIILILVEKYFISYSL